MSEIFDHDYPQAEGLSPRLGLAVRNIEFARRYTKTSLENLEPADWFWTPTVDNDYVTHIAWQVGHLAMAEYGLTLFLQRGRQSVDASLMSGSFRKLFMKGTQPVADRTKYPSPEEILAVLDTVHQQAISEYTSFEATLDDEVGPPHAGFATKYGSLLFAADHEMMHAGQIGMLRRMMGKTAMR